ncbi:tetratricopeptide repeat protein [Candidatus Binatia bacterium]|nr:tetratricopeptide repeat protein [Candidatus Binatia bacterium]
MNEPTFSIRSTCARSAAIALGAALALALGGAPARAAGDDPVPVPKPTSSPSLKTTAALLTNEGIALSNAGDWQGAEDKYRAAIRADRRIPEAWNGLGHALKMQRRYDGALLAYDEALKLRPNYPKALEYLGETYVAMGRLDDARNVLARLEKLDGTLSGRLAKAIQGETAQTASW